MQTKNSAENCLLRIWDFQSHDSPDELNNYGDEAQARWYCEQLEDGHILMFEHLPFDFPEEDRAFLISPRHEDSWLHKNISYRPQQDLVHGFASNDRDSAQRLHEVMRRYSRRVVEFLSRLLAPYASRWALDNASFRPESEEDRKLPSHKRNDLLHIDALPGRPTSGGRILRCFTNINPTRPRVWQTTDPFSDLALKHARNAGLNAIATRNGSGLDSIWRNFGRALGFKTTPSSPYDKFMLRFHDYLKENTEFQRDCAKIRLEFPPGATWISFTDSVPHALVSGQFAVEQTLIVPVETLIHPEKSPLRTLEILAGLPLIPGNGRMPTRMQKRV